MDVVLIVPPEVYARALAARQTLIHVQWEDLESAGIASLLLNPWLSLATVPEEFGCEPWRVYDRGDLLRCAQRLVPA